MAKISDFTPDAGNANKGTQRGLKALDTSLRQYGAGRSILVDKKGRVIAGNKTLERAADIGIEDAIVVETDGTKLVAVKRTDLDLESEDGKARALATYDNRVGQIDLDWDIDALKSVDSDVLKDLWTVDELDKLGVMEKPMGDAEPQIDRAAELQEKWQVKTGDLWRIGEHRLLCGDSTKREDVERVMGGEKAKLYATDPPYGVAYNDETGSGKGDTIANDENDGKKLQAFLEMCFSAWLPFLDDKSAWYLWHAQLTQGFFAAAAAAAAADILIHRQIIWVKPSLIMGHGDYHWQHELCFYGWRRGNRPPFYGQRNQSTVWAIGRENDGIHPTQKPVALWDAPINNHTKFGEICAEPFSGSGSQIVACQNLGRKCRAIEISPEYCAVTLERMATAFPGIEIERLSS